MKSKRKGIYIALAGCFEWLLFLPIWLAVDAFLIPSAVQGDWLAVLPPMLLAGAAAGTYLRVVWQQWLAALAFGGIIGWFASGQGWVFALTSGALSALVLLQGLTLRSRLDQTKPYWIGLGLYFAAAVAFPFIPALEGKLLALSAGGTGCLLVLLFLFNARFLRTAALAVKKQAAVPAVIRKYNAIFMAVIGILAIVLTLVFGNVLGAVLFAAMRWLVGLLFSAPAEEVPPPVSEPAGMQPPMLPGGEEEPNELWRIISEIAGYVLLSGILLAILFGIGYWLYKYGGEWVRTWVKHILTILSFTRAEDVPAGYTDEETGVFSWEQIARNWQDSWLGKWMARSREERWEDAQTNAERIRFLYRRWLRSAVEAGYEAKPALTPKETEADVRRWSEQEKNNRFSTVKSSIDELLGLYYRVRYAGEEINSGEVEKVKVELERNGK